MLPRRYQHDVLQNGHELQLPADLKCAAESLVKGLVQGQPVDSLSLEGYLAFIGFVESGDQIEECRFPGSIRAYQTGNTVRGHVEADPIHRFDSSEVPSYIAERQNRRIVIRIQRLLSSCGFSCKTASELYPRVGNGSRKIRDFDATQSCRRRRDFTNRAKSLMLRTTI